jgi:feruloyl-CoA synthase
MGQVAGVTGDVRPWRQVRLGDLTPIVDERPDGSVVMRARQPLGPYPRVLTERVAHWAGAAPDRALLSWRDGTVRSTITYGAAWPMVRAISQSLIDRGVSAERPLAILSGNDVEHLLLALAALHAGIPYAPISPAYSLVSNDFGALKQVISLLTPGLVYVADTTKFARALSAAVAPEVEVIDRPAFGTLTARDPGPDVDRRHAAIQPDDIAKILFTSGSTGVPKGVINTHRMLCSNQQMILQTLPFLGDTPPVLVDWLPWHHTFGGNHNIGIVLYNGGSLHIDDGRPLPGAFDESVRCLREVVPTVYLNVPRGFEELLRALGDDRALAERFFSTVQVLFYAAASLSQHVSEELERLALETCGERLVLITGLGSTETAPMAICRPWASEVSSAIGLPVPGVDAKLAPVAQKLEMRVRGPNVTPGYWRQGALTREAFDEEGFYCMGDAVRPIDRQALAKGLMFDGRIKEDFKLSTGTWVSVGPLRARIVAHFAPLVRDAVIAGHDRDDVGLLLVPDVDACRTLVPDLPPDAPPRAVVGHAAVRERLRERLLTFAAAATGSASRPRRAVVLDTPPSLDAGEVTDKGSLNQRAVLERRQSLVDDLYADRPPAHVIACDGSNTSSVRLQPDRVRLPPDRGRRQPDEAV